MPDPTTARLGLPYIQGTDDISAFPSTNQTQMQTLDAAILSRGFGKSIVDTPETVASSTYSLAPTPDRVQNIVMPQDGLIAVLFQAAWQESVAGAGRAAIFVGANQLKVAFAGGPPYPIAAATGSTANAHTDVPLVTTPLGLGSSDPGGGMAYGPDVTTGQAVGLGAQAPLKGDAGSGAIPLAWPGVCFIFAAAGTYDISVQYKASSGSVYPRKRKLWVWNMF